MNKTNSQILEMLNELYGEPATELNYSNEYELVVAVLLSAQCTDKKVNQTTPTLFSEYPNLKALAKAQLRTVEKIIRPINYYKTKSRHLIAMAKMVIENYKGKIPLTHNELITLPGVGRKTANVVLGELGIEHTLPVDTHVFRVARRLGLTSSSTREAVEDDLRKAFPSLSWRPLHHSLIFHGRRVCIARNPKCTDCKLLKLCPEGNKIVSV